MSIEHHSDVAHSLNVFVNYTIIPKYLKEPTELWQPSDLLPSLEEEDWHDRMTSLRTAAKGLPDSLLVLLVGNTLTEEALPTYMSQLNRTQGIGDETGASDNGWARWNRYWTAEEGRHDASLTSYLLLSGRVQMKSVELTKNYLIRHGFDPGSARDPYAVIAYTCMQEPATQVSHKNIAQQARRSGEPVLAKLCGYIAADEQRHAFAYQAMLKEIIGIDPDGIIALKNIVQNKMRMPGSNMNNPLEPDLFERFSRVGQQSKMYTGVDYVEIVDRVVKTLDLEHASATGDAAAAQEYLCNFAQRVMPVVQRQMQRHKTESPTPFSWIYGRSV